MEKPFLHRTQGPRFCSGNSNQDLDGFQGFYQPHVESEDCQHVTHRIAKDFLKKGTAKMSEEKINSGAIPNNLKNYVLFHVFFHKVLQVSSVMSC